MHDRLRRRLAERQGPPGQAAKDGAAGGRRKNGWVTKAQVQHFGPVPVVREAGLPTSFGRIQWDRSTPIPMPVEADDHAPMVFDFTGD